MDLARSEAVEPFVDSGVPEPALLAPSLLADSTRRLAAPRPLEEERRTRRTLTATRVRELARQVLPDRQSGTWQVLRKSESEITAGNRWWMLRVSFDHARLAQEHAALRRLHGLLPFATPAPLELVRSGSLACFCYPRIAGRPVTRRLMAQLCASEKQLLVESVADFYRRLHQLPVALGARPVAPGRAGQANGLAMRMLHEWLTPTERRALAGVLDEFAENRDGFRTTIVQQPDSASHLIVDAGDPLALGVVSIRGLSLGDPAGDFEPLIATFGFEMVVQVLREYGGRCTELARRVLHRHLKHAIDTALASVQRESVSARAKSQALAELLLSLPRYRSLLA